VPGSGASDRRIGEAAQAFGQGDYARAEVLYRQLADEENTDSARAAALAELASVYQNLGRLAEARAAIEQALAACPENADLNYRMGLLHLADGDALGALDYFHLALHYAPGLFHACAGRVKALLALGRPDEEGLAYREFLAANPGHPVATYSLAGWYHARGEYEEAADLLRPLAALTPPNREACNFLGLILGREFGRFEESERVLRRALLEDPLWPAGLCNLGWILLEKGDYQQGMKLLDAALEQDPHDNEVRLIRGYMNLKRGEFRQGWRDYAARHRSALAVERPYRFPEWDGAPIPGRRLLIYGEQGLGDQIMFASCFEEAMQRAGPCTIECNPKLVALFARSFPYARIQENVPSGAEPEWLAHEDPFDFQIPMGNLPGFLRHRWEDFPRHGGYLRVAPERVEYWRARLAELGPGPKIGISWRGGVKATRRHMRSLALPQLVPLLRQPARFVSLQYGECAEDLAALGRDHGIALPHWAAALEDYDETAALVAALDLSVSVCTAVIHLAGALGKPVWVLAPAVPEWRYLDRGERLPWYPSARVIRQSLPGHWQDVIGRVTEELMQADSGLAR
jgi:tetratricopeptide (TPR) repeat protein